MIKLSNVMIGVIILAFLCFAAFLIAFIVLVDAVVTFQEQHREFEKNVHDTLNGIYEELRISNFLKIEFSEVHKNED